MWRVSFLMGASVIGITSVSVPGESWARWNGAALDNKSNETGLMPRWPEGGPKMLWSYEELGRGWSSPSVVGETIYITGLVDNMEVVHALYLDGKLKWKTPCGPGWTRSRPGARCQPTVEKGRLYVITSSVQAWCLDANGGGKVWSVDVGADFEGQPRSFGDAESPLIVGDKVIVTPGGRKATMVALDVATGKVVWSTKDLTQPASFASPILIERGGRKIIATMIKECLVGVDAADGSVLWKHPHRNKYDNHINSPLYRDGKILTVSGYGAGAKMFELSEDGKSIKLLWEKAKPDTCHGGFIWLDGHIYGSSHFPSGGGGKWVCLEAKTGNIVYEQPWVKAGSVACADGYLYCYGEDGKVALVPARPDAKGPVSIFPITKGKDEHWAHPVISGGRMYVRHGQVLMAFDIRKEAPATAPGG